jgi:hypothetical protein
MPAHSPDRVNMPTAAPARKVVGASAGAGLGGVSAGLILWGLDDFVFQPDVANSVPGPVSAFVIAVVPLALSFLGGYFTKRSTDELMAPAPDVQD